MRRGFDAYHAAQATELQQANTVRATYALLHGCAALDCRRVVWLLFRPPTCSSPAHPLGREQTCDGHGDRGDGPEIGGTLAWLLGPALEALPFQVGVIEALLEARERADAMLCSGYGIVAGVLSSAADARTLRRRWERLRAERFLVHAACKHLAAGNVSRFLRRPRLSARADHAFAALSRQVEMSNGIEQIYCVISSGISVASSGGKLRAEVLREALARSTDEVGDIAVMLEHLRSGPKPTTVRVIGISAAAWRHRSVVSHVRSLEQAGAAVTAYLTPYHSPLSIAAWLLPGLGEIERTMLAGRRAAEQPRRVTEATSSSS